MHKTDRRIHVYRRVLTILTPGVIVMWLLQGPYDPFIRIAYPIIAACLALAGWQLARSPAKLQTVERRTFWLLVVTAVGGVAYRLFTIPDLAPALQAVSLFSLPLLTLCLVMSQLVFGTTRALRVGIGILGASALVGIVGIARHGASGIAGAAVTAFAWFLLVLAATILFLYVVARAKDDALAAEIEAERMRSMAFEDALTGLPNRRRLEEELDRQRSLAERSGRPFAVILCDLDGFKALNDGHGHEAGDAVLHDLGSLLQRVVRGGDVAGRWGGEEFLVVAPEADAAEGVALAERIRERIERHDFPGGLAITASFGVAVWRPASSTTQLLREADAHLYAAKRAGRNQVRADAAAGPAPEGVGA